MATLTLLIVANQGGGKGSAKTHVEKTYGADTCRFSTPIRAVCDAAEIPQERAEMQKLARVFRDAYGEDFWERLMLKRCKASDAGIMVVDGAREIGDIMTLMADPSAFMIYLWADAATRMARMTGRGENVGEAEMTAEAFMAAEHHPNERAITDMVGWVEETYPEKYVMVDNSAEWSYTAKTIDLILTTLLKP